MPPEREMRLVIPSEVTNVRFVGAAVRAVAESLGFPPPDQHAVELCAVEAVTNAIRHAYRDESEHEVTVRLVVANGALRMDVTDYGEPMPKARRGTPAPLPEAGEALLAEGGQGLRLMHELMDSVSYRASGDSNTLTLVKKMK